MGSRVLCFTTFTAKTSADGVAFTQDESHLWTLRDGKVVRLAWFHDRREALEAVGLLRVSLPAPASPQRAKPRFRSGLRLEQTSWGMTFLGEFTPSETVQSQPRPFMALDPL